jgi:diguanylate cyclase (GGDEF)-like protein
VTAPAYVDENNGRAPQRPSAGDGRLAARSAAGVFFLGPMLAATLVLRQPEAPHVIAAAVLGGVSLLAALVLLILDWRGHAGPAVITGATLLMVGLVGGLVAASGGTESLYWPLYAFPIIHAAVFQSRARLALISAVTIAAFLAPMAYDHTATRFTILACVAIPPIVLAALVLNLSVASLSGEREVLADREQAALRLADEDPLTGLGNYRVFWRQLQAESSRVRRHGGTFSLVLLDLDRFKSINDEVGHTAGDRVLQRTAHALAEELRAEDVLCRQGGDEFAVIAVEAGGEEVADLAGRLVDAVGKAGGDPEQAPATTASAGYATFGEEATSAEELVARADEALRLAKRRGRAGASSALLGAERLAAQGPATEPAREREPGVSHLNELAALARALAGTRDATDVTLTAVAHVAGALDNVGVSIYRWDRGEGSLELTAFSGRRPSGQEEEGRRFRDDEGIMGVVVREGRAVIAESPHERARPELAEARSELGVPVLVGTEVWGAMQLISDRADAYGAESVTMAEAMAEQIGRALACAWVVHRLEEARNGQVDWLAAAVDAPQSRARKVADLAEQIGRALGVRGDELRDLRYAALFHDIGTLGVPEPVLTKPGRLTSDERAVMREHVIFGERMLRRVPQMRDAARIVRHAHERVDGGGYPDGLAGEDIPLASRVVLACDAYIAMTSPRPWRSMLSTEEAITELRRVSGRQLDRRVVDALVELLGEPAARVT